MEIDSELLNYIDNDTTTNETIVIDRGVQTQQIPEESYLNDMNIEKIYNSLLCNFKNLNGKKIIIILLFLYIIIKSNVY